MFKEFKVKDVFDVSPVNRITEPNKSYIPDDEIIGQGGNTPYIAAISKNNGITGYSYREPNNMGDCVTLSTTAASPDTVFYQPDAFIGRQQMSAFRRKDGNPLGYGCGIYLATLVRKLTIGFNYGNKLTNDFLKNMTISLPVIENSNPDHEYTVDDIDWDYMSERIRELEEERIRELDAYLKAAGLDNYELTNDEEMALNGFFDGAVQWADKPLTDFFDVSTTTGIDRSKVTFDDNGKYDFIGRSVAEWGIQGKLNALSYEPNPRNTFSLIQIGDTKALWRENEWYASQNLFMLKPKTRQIEECYKFFQSAVNAAMKVYGSNYNSYPTLADLNNTSISLPVNPDGSVSFAYIYIYIRALEKETIKEVVQYKEKMMSIYRSVV